jgi:GNAT superfamily N-acetyltransferase
MCGVDKAIQVHPVSPDRWPDLVQLFERPGPRGGTPMPGSCWCMWWRHRTGDAAKNKNAMRSLVRGGDEPGLLAYADGVPIGWVSVGRRDDFGQLMRSPQYKPPDHDEQVFAIVCFYVDPRSKRSGVGSALLDAAIKWARRHGAKAIEAYPNSTPDFMGRREAFERRGFKRIRVAGKRSIMRLDVPGRKPPATR